MQSGWNKTNVTENETFKSGFKVVCRCRRRCRPVLVHCSSLPKANCGMMCAQGLISFVSRASSSPPPSPSSSVKISFVLHPLRLFPGKGRRKVKMTLYVLFGPIAKTWWCRSQRTWRDNSWGKYGQTLRLFFSSSSYFLSLGSRDHLSFFILAISISSYFSISENFAFFRFSWP